MPNPKDPAKLAAYRIKQRRIALQRGYGQWMIGKKKDPLSIKMASKSLRKTCSTAKYRQKMSKIAKDNGFGKWMKGRKAYPKFILYCKSRKGKTYKEIYGKERAKEERKKRRVSNQKRWEGTENQPQRSKHNSDSRYSAWRKKVFNRDDYTCQRCDKRGGEIQAHHIKAWAKYPELRYKVSNGVTMCVACHKILHSLR